MDNMFLLRLKMAETEAENSEMNIQRLNIRLDPEMNIQRLNIRLDPEMNIQRLNIRLDPEMNIHPQYQVSSRDEHTSSIAG